LFLNQVIGLLKSHDDTRVFKSGSNPFCHHLYLYLRNLVEFLFPLLFCLITSIVSHKGPQNTSVLVSHGNTSLVIASAFFKPSDPITHGIKFVICLFYDSSGAMNQQAS
jgi:hypothetical protein